jgi:hypothetical protein
MKKAKRIIGLWTFLIMDKLKLTGQNLGQVSHSKLGHTLYIPCYCIHKKMARLKAENSAQTTFRFSPVSFRAPRFNRLLFFSDFTLAAREGERERERLGQRRAKGICLINFEPQKCEFFW